jgi:methionyl-tRNA synthetase
MLLAAGEPLPDTLFVHGYLTGGGQKFSKSLGNGVDPVALVERYGVDPVRYWLLRDVPPTEDADFTPERLERRYTADLANDLGNLLQRTVSLLHRYRAGRLPELEGPRPAPGGPEPGPGGGAPAVAAVAADAVRRLHAALGAYDPREALVAIWDLVGRANRYVEETAPWALARRERDGDPAAGAALDRVLATLAESLRLAGEALRPLLPRTGEAVLTQLGLSPAADWPEALRWGRLPAGTVAPRPRPLFPRLTERLAILGVDP